MKCTQITATLLSTLLLIGCDNYRRARPPKVDNSTITNINKYKVKIRHKIGNRLTRYRDRKSLISDKNYSRRMDSLTQNSSNIKPLMIVSKRISSYRGKSGSVNLAHVRVKMMNYINSIRESGSSSYDQVGRLRFDNMLADASTAHVKDMAINNFLSHVGSGRGTDIAKKSVGSGSNFYERILFFGYPIKPKRVVGEILTYTKYSIVGNGDIYHHFVHAIDNFLKSPTHSSILFDKRYTDIGIAAYKDKEKIYWAIEFGEIR